MLCRIREDAFRKLGNAVQSISEGWIESGFLFDHEYTIYGIGTYKGQIKVLIDPRDNCQPFWYSLREFVITDPSMPAGWEICADPASEWEMILGYDDLVKSEDHFNGLLEREENDLAIFARVKQELR